MGKRCKGPEGPSSHTPPWESRQPSFLLTWRKIYYKPWWHSISTWEPGLLICKVPGDNHTVCDMKKNECPDQDDSEPEVMGELRTRTPGSAKATSPFRALRNGSMNSSPRKANRAQCAILAWTDGKGCQSADGRSWSWSLWDGRVILSGLEAKATGSQGAQVSHTHISEDMWGQSTEEAQQQRNKLPPRL